MNTTIESVPFDAKSLGPFRYAEGFAIQSEQAVATHVALLLLWCSPSAIRFLVISVLIGETVDAMFQRRGRPHIIQKCFNPTPPLLAHRNAASAIPWVMHVIRVIASLFNRGPYHKFSAMTEPVLEYYFLVVTPAAYGRPIPQIFTEADTLYPAVTTAKPIFQSWYSMESNPVPKSLSSYVYS